MPAKKTFSAAGAKVPGEGFHDFEQEISSPAVQDDVNLMNF
jgi:hypothetical protein